MWRTTDLFHFNFPRLDLRQVENVVDKVDEEFTVFLDSTSRIDVLWTAHVF